MILSGISFWLLIRERERLWMPSSKSLLPSNLETDIVFNFHYHFQRTSQRAQTGGRFSNIIVYNNSRWITLWITQRVLWILRKSDRERSCQCRNRRLCNAKKLDNLAASNSIAFQWNFFEELNFWQKNVCLPVCLVDCIWNRRLHNMAVHIMNRIGIRLMSFGS